MDVETVVWCLPFVTAGALALLASKGEDWFLVGVMVGVVLLWGLVWGVRDIGCVVEGFADGPLPVECRPASRP